MYYINTIKTIKMGKITIKHYINTELKPLKENNRILYPLYVQVIYNRNVYKFKSNNTTFQYLTESEISNIYVIELLKGELLAIERTIQLLEKHNPKLINGKNIAHLSKPFHIIIEENFSKLVAKECPQAPYFYKNSSFTEINEVLFYVEAIQNFLSLNKKISYCYDIIQNLGYFSISFYEENYLTIDFITGDKFEQIKNIIGYTYGNYEPDQLNAINALHDLINI